MIQEKDLPQAYKDAMKDLLKEDYDAYIKSLEKKPYSGIRTNLLKLTPKRLKEILDRDFKKVPWVNEGFYFEEEKGVLSSPTLSENPKIKSISKNPYYFAGLYYIQEPSAMTPAMAAGIVPGDKVLDLCAAPGGKSFLLADKIDNEALIYSCDVSENKVNLITENAKVQGFKNIIPLVADARVFDERFAESDLVLADLPCSGIGIIGKKPDIKYRLNAENMISLAALQKEILDNVSQYVKIGGELIFSTCTLNKAENEENVSLFLKNHSNFKAVDLTKRLKSTLIEKFDKDELKKGVS